MGGGLKIARNLTITAPRDTPTHKTGPYLHRNARLCRRTRTTRRSRIDNWSRRTGLYRLTTHGTPAAGTGDLRSGPPHSVAEADAMQWRSTEPCLVGRSVAANATGYYRAFWDSLIEGCL